MLAKRRLRLKKTIWLVCGFESAKKGRNGEVTKSERAGIRVFRYTEANFSNVPIFPGDSLQVVAVEIAIDHLEIKELTGLSRQEVYDLTMNGVIVAEATVDGKLLRAEKPIREIFSLADGSGRVPLRSIVE